MNNFKLISIYIWLVCSLLTVCTSSLKGQIVNGGFEDWYFVEENKEYPVGWDLLLQNRNKAISKSTNSQDGLYAVNIASLNFLDGTYGPAYLGTKYKPTDYNLKFSFYYLIDSIEAQSNAVVELYQRNSEGDYIIFKSVKYNEASVSFIREEINITIETLDTLFIVLIAENVPKPIGHDGFISVLFDNIILEYTSSTNDISNTPCNVSTLISGNSMSLPVNCDQYTKYVIFSTIGQIISKGRILDNTIVLPYIGMYYVSVISDSNDIQVFKVIKY